MSAISLSLYSNSNLECVRTEEPFIGVLRSAPLRSDKPGELAGLPRDDQRRWVEEEGTEKEWEGHQRKEHGKGCEGKQQKERRE